MSTCLQQMKSVVTTKKQDSFFQEDIFAFRDKEMKDQEKINHGFKVIR